MHINVSSFHREAPFLLAVASLQTADLSCHFEMAQKRSFTSSEELIALDLARFMNIEKHPGRDRFDPCRRGPQPL
jgi:hypothetical protein